jgi:hypothetical protein
MGHIGERFVVNLALVFRQSDVSVLLSHLGEIEQVM